MTPEQQYIHTFFCQENFLKKFLQLLKVFPRHFQRLFFVARPIPLDVRWKGLYTLTLVLGDLRSFAPGIPTLSFAVIHRQVKASKGKCYAGNGGGGGDGRA